MKHIWDAIDLCHRKLIDERERLGAMPLTDETPVSAGRAGTATVDRTQELLEEIDAQLRAVSAARRDFKDLYAEPSGEPRDKE